MISIFFIVLIGPANWYVVLRRMKKPPLFLVTTPAIALVASVLMLTYSFVSEGFGTHVAVRTLAVLDSEAHRGVTWSYHSVYAGIAPYGGLRFDASTLVLPGDIPDARRTVSWADGLRMRGAWLPARTACSYVTCAQYPARWRVRIERSGGSWTVTNGLPCAMTNVVFGTGEGVARAVDVPAGGTAIAEVVGSSAVRELGSLASDFRRFGVAKSPADLLGRAMPGGGIAYVATLAAPLGAELGITEYVEADGRHVVLGSAESGAAQEGAP